jgi:hypothetical protein
MADQSTVNGLDQIAHQLHGAQGREDGRPALDRRFAFQLAGLAALLFVLYLGFGFVVPQTAGRLGRPSAALIGELELWKWVLELGVPVPRSGVGVAALVVGLAGVAFAAYGLALRASWKRSNPAALTVAVVAAITFAGVSLLYLPNLSSDIFNYMMRGRLAAVYGESPYYVAVDRFPDDPFYRYTSPEYRHNPGEKLPAWMIFNRAFAHIAGNDPPWALLTYRAGFLLFHLGSLLLIVHLLKRTRPELQLAGVIAYGWSPIVAIHALNKTDTIMVFFLLAAVLFLAMGRRQTALVSLTLSAFVKLITLPLVALLLLGHLRTRRWRPIVLGAIVVLVTVGVIYAPFTHDPRLVLQHVGVDQIVAVVGRLLALEPAASTHPAAEAAADGGGVIGRVVPHLGIVSFLLWLGCFLWASFACKATWEVQLRRWAIVTFLLVLLMSKLEFSWYLMTPLALASLAGSGALTLIIVLVSFSSFLFNVWQSAAASGFELPHLLVNVSRAAVHLGFAGAALVLALTITLASPKARRQLAARVIRGRASASSYLS